MKSLHGLASPALTNGTMSSASGGSIVQSGAAPSVSGSGGTVKVVFPVAFTTVPIVVATLTPTGGTYSYNTNPYEVSVGEVTTTGFTLEVNAASAATPFWIAIGE